MNRFTIHSKEYRNYYQRFMKYLGAIGYSQTSCKTFETGIKEFLYWLEKRNLLDVHQVEGHDIENFYEHLQQRPNLKQEGTLSETRISICMYVLKLFFCYLQDVEQLENNPMSELSFTEPERKTRENLLSQEDIQKLYDHCETPRQRAMLGILYGCGLRRQEAVKLNAKDIHFKSALLYVREGKGGRKRTIPLSQKVLSDLKDYYYNQRPGEMNYNNPDSAEAFMLNRHGTRMQGDTYSEELKRLIAKARLNAQVSVHHLRHAIATHLLESGMKTEHVKDFLGHMSIETTQTYTHITTAEMKKTTAYGTSTIPA